MEVILHVSTKPMTNTFHKLAMGRWKMFPDKKIFVPIKMCGSAVSVPLQKSWDLQTLGLSLSTAMWARMCCRVQIARTTLYTFSPRYGHIIRRRLHLIYSHHVADAVLKRTETNRRICIFLLRFTNTMSVWLCLRLRVWWTHRNVLQRPDALSFAFYSRLPCHPPFIRYAWPTATPSFAT